MNFFEKIIAALSGKMQTPTSFGWFHLLSLAVMIGCIVLVCLTCRNLSSKKFKIITLIVAIVLILFEVYKQLVFSYNPSTDSWNYQWYSFPFQFCSTPMYVLLLIGLLKENKFSNWLCSFMATFGIVAGTIVMLYPGDVFVETIGINIQTMVHHGAMVVMGVLMWVSGRVKFEHRTILKGMSVFGALCVVAMAMNITWYLVADKSYYFNMFYISPFVRCHLPILGNIWDISYVLFLFSYIVGFSFAGYLVLLCSMGIRKLNGLIHRKKSSLSSSINESSQSTADIQGTQIEANESDETI